MKSIILSIFFLLLFCNCSTKFNAFLESIKGEWQVTEYNCDNDNLSNSGHYLIGFENNNEFWITKIEDRTDKFISSRFSLINSQKETQIVIKNCDLKTLNGVYNFKMDTVFKGHEQNIIQISLSKENVFIKAIRLKNK